MARKKKQTLSEFKAWLEGVEELQPDNWSPNQQQWVLIREKIKGIVVIPPKINQQAVNVNPVLPNNPVLPSNFTLPPVINGIPAGDVDMSTAAKQMLNPTAGTKSKTPDIDTSEGDYHSNFG